MAQSNALADERLLLASKGFDLKPIDKNDPALRIPRTRFRMDAWENLSTGFGSSSQHPANNSQFTGISKVSEYQQEELYRSDWVTRKGIDAPAEDMTRNGISYQHSNDDKEEGKTGEKTNGKTEAQKSVEDFDKLLNEKYSLWQTAFQAVALARASGGSMTLFNFDDIQTEAEFAVPLNENQVTEIRWVMTVPAWFAIPITWYRDINHPKWGQPEHYQVVLRNTGGGITLNVHESRMIRMDGRFTTQTPKTQNRGWNDSEIQAVFTALRDYGICVTESNSTMQTFTQDYLGMKGLAEKVMTGSDPDYILDRLSMTHFSMTSNKLNVYDADSEKMERQGTPITGLSELWDRYTEAICGAWSIPKARFFSSESGQLGGNSSDSDTRTYFNGILSKQEIQLRPWLNQFMYSVNMASGSLAELPSYTFNPLQEQSDQEKAATRYTQAQTDHIYIEDQVVSAEEIGISRFSKEKPDLETVMVDFDAREEMKDERTPEEIESMAGELEGLKMEKAVNEAAKNQNILQRPEQLEDQEDDLLEDKGDAADRKDSKTIIITPEINIENPAPVINFNGPIDHTDDIREIRKGLEDVTGKLNEEIDFED